MKISKTLLPALVMLLVSAVMLSTASFAWFAMQDTVDATGMNVSVKSDSLYLYIQAAAAEGDAPAASVIVEGNKKSDDGKALGGNDSIKPAAIETGKNSLEDLLKPGSWYTARSADPGESTISGNKTYLTTGNFGEYVVTYKFYVTIAQGSQDISALKITNFSLTGDDGKDLPVKVVIASEAGSEEFDSKKTAGAGNLLASNDTLTVGEVVSFYVFVYYDGNDKSVFTNNLAKISQANISFSVQATPVATD